MERKLLACDETNKNGFTPTNHGSKQQMVSGAAGAQRVNYLETGETTSIEIQNSWVKAGACRWAFPKFHFNATIRSTNQNNDTIHRYGST